MPTENMTSVFVHSTPYFSDGSSPATSIFGRWDDLARISHDRGSRLGSGMVYSAVRKLAAKSVLYLDIQTPSAALNSPVVIRKEVCRSRNQPQTFEDTIDYLLDKNPDYKKVWSACKKDFEISRLYEKASEMRITYPDMIAIKRIEDSLCILFLVKCKYAKGKKP